MKANELRIGNWILIPYQNAPIAIPAHETKVQGITIFGEILTNNTTEHEGLKTHFNYASGIPLTEEWLLKFGFEKIGGYLWNCKKLGARRFINNPYGITHFEMEFGETHIRSVHQLQNLYYALTGNELEVKP